MSGLHTIDNREVDGQYDNFPGVSLENRRPVLLVTMRFMANHDSFTVSSL